MAHTPVNHPARPIYRAIGGLTGLYLVAFGGLGVIASAGNDLLAQDDTQVLGQGTNLGFSLLSILLGGVVLAGTVIVLMVIGLVLLMVGMYGKVGTEDEQEAWQKARLVL